MIFEGPPRVRAKRRGPGVSQTLERQRPPSSTLLTLDPNPERAVELANEATSAFTSRFQEHWLAGMRDKFGVSREYEGDLELANALLRMMHENASDYTLTFRRLCDAAADEKADANVRALFADPAAYHSWLARWRSGLAAERLEPDARARVMRSVNPAFIPRNHGVE
jgi:serine/tyrosine/threonine adenylyltransferase